MLMVSPKAGEFSKFNRIKKSNPSRLGNLCQEQRLRLRKTKRSLSEPLLVLSAIIKIQRRRIKRFVMVGFIRVMQAILMTMVTSSSLVVKKKSCAPKQAKLFPRTLLKQGLNSALISKRLWSGGKPVIILQALSILILGMSAVGQRIECFPIRFYPIFPNSHLLRS